MSAPAAVTRRIRSMRSLPGCSNRHLLLRFRDRPRRNLLRRRLMIRASSSWVDQNLTHNTGSCAKPAFRIRKAATGASKGAAVLQLQPPQLDSDRTRGREVHVQITFAPDALQLEVLLCCLDLQPQLILPLQ